MPGVRLTKTINPEVKKNLGFDIVANLSFFWGVPYPLPDWYHGLLPLQKRLWALYCRFGDLMTFLLFVSNLVEIFISYEDIRAFVTCIGTITYIICFRIKMHIFKQQTKTLEKVIDSLHFISEHLDNNPVRDKKFFLVYQGYLKHALFFGKGKIGAIMGGVVTLAIFEMMQGFFVDLRTKKNLPMYGWFPYDPFYLTSFEITCLFQLISYSSFLLKDVVVDLFFLIILVVLNTHLVYLRQLLKLIVEQNEKYFGLVLLKDKKETLKWWVKHHQMVLRTIEDFKEITNPYLFSKYISVGIILFFGGVLVTSNTEYDLVQQMIVLAINSSNLLQLYIFSVMGDEITENGLRLTENGLHIDVINNSPDIRKTYLFLTTRCTKPILIHFGRINPLCVASFGQIVKITFSYFITIVQIRSQAYEKVEKTMLFQNETLSSIYSSN